MTWTFLGVLTCTPACTREFILVYTPTSSIWESLFPEPVSTLGTAALKTKQKWTKSDKFTEIDSIIPILQMRTWDSEPGPVLGFPCGLIQVTRGSPSNWYVEGTGLIPFTDALTSGGCRGLGGWGLQLGAASCVLTAPSVHPSAHVA